MKHFKKLFLFTSVLLFTFPLYSLTTRWKEIVRGKEYTFEYLLDHADLSQDKKVCIASFTKAYEGIPLHTLQVTNITEFISNGFEHEKTLFHAKKDNFYYVRVKDDENVIGFITFEQDIEHHYNVSLKKQSGLIRWLAIDPAYARKGSGLKNELGIGGYLISIIPMIAPGIKKVCTHPRKVNTSAKKFYEKFGFKKSKNKHIHEGFDLSLYDTYEYTFNSPSQ